MFEILAFCEDRPIDVKEGGEDNIFFPVRDEEYIPNRKFRGFYGLRDSLSGITNWKPASSRSIATISGGSLCRGAGRFIPDRCFFDRIYMTRKRKRKIAAQRREFSRINRERRRLQNINFNGIVGIPNCNATYLPYPGRNMGLINCDAFWDIPNEKKVNVLVEIPVEDNTNVWLVFKSRFSVMNPSATYSDKFSFHDIPEKKKIWIVATKITEDGKPLLGFAKANTSDERISVELEEMESEEALAAALRKVNL